MTSRPRYPPIIPVLVQQAHGTAYRHCVPYTVVAEFQEPSPRPRAVNTWFQSLLNAQYKDGWMDGWIIYVLKHLNGPHHKVKRLALEFGSTLALSE